MSGSRIVRVGVGSSTLTDSRAAGLEAAEQALSGMGEPTIVVLFTTDLYEPKAVLDAVRSKTGGACVAGISCAGILTADGVFPQGVGVCAVKGNFPAVTLLQPNAADASEAGRRAGGRILEAGIEAGTVLVLPEPFGMSQHDFLRGLYDRLGADFQYTGGAAWGGAISAEAYQFTDGGVETSATALAAVGRGVASVAVGHGWTPMGHPMIVTKARGTVVYEIDGEPAFTAYQKQLGGMSREEFKQLGSLHPMGFPDVFGRYQIRDPLEVLEDGSIRFIMEVPAQAVGSIMEGQLDRLIAAAEETAHEAASGVEEPSGILVFDCISRQQLLQDRMTEEIEAFRRGAGRTVPLIGALTFGEVGAHEVIPLMHNKTASVVVFGGGRP